MRARQRSDGSYGFVAPDVAEAGERVLQDFALTECGLCPDFRYAGTVADGKAAFREHALLSHPEAVDRRAGERRAAARLARRDTR